MGVPPIRRATRDDIRPLSETLGQAFMDDPVLQWLFPNRSRRERLAAPFFAWTLETQSLPLDEVWCTDDGLAAALWAPPNRWRVGIMEQVRLLPRFVGMARVRTPRLMVGFNKLEARHPRASHWYLYFLGTRPDCQGSGYGSALLTQMFERSDRDGVPVFLEAPNPEVIPFYSRHGFAITDVVTVRNGPHFTQMWRDAQPPEA